MWEEVLKAVPVFLSSMVKFIFGPLGGFAAGLHMITTMIITVAAMMTVVVSFIFFGEFLKNTLFRRFFNNRKYSRKTGRYSWIWRRYGVAGVAILTPLLLTPIGGTLLALSLGASRQKLIMYMLISASAWSVVFTLTVYFFGNEVFPDFIK